MSIVLELSLFKVILPLAKALKVKPANEANKPSSSIVGFSFTA
nr:MAG TPA: hypothetical protein [Caudoviricetes sp.]